MTKSSKIIAVFVVIAILLIGVGYAAISNITLTISGSAEATPDDKNFSVKFNTSEKPVTESKGTITAEITNDKTATINVSGLTAKGDKATATYKIKNDSPDLSANLTSSVSQKNSNYFKVESKISEQTLAHGEETTITVDVELLKTPINEEENLSETINVTIEAEPVQPEA